MAFLTPREVSRLIRRSEQTLAKWRCYGYGPAYVKLGNRVVYDEADVNAWIAERKRLSTSGETVATVSGVRSGNAA